MMSKLKRVRSLVLWLIGCPLQLVFLNIYGVARVKSRLAGIGGVLRNHKGKVVLMFSKNASTKKSNEAEVMLV